MGVETSMPPKTIPAPAGRTRGGSGRLNNILIFMIRV